jgi:D-alanyl-D-alanine dipeptidase
MSKYLILFLVIGTLSCKSKQVKEKNPENMGHSSKVTRSDTLEIVKEESEIEINDKIDTLEQKLIDAGLIDIQNIITDILIDVRYSSTNNFMKQDVYGDLNRIYLQESVANDLLKCQLKLKEIDSTLSLLVYDGVRPRSVQQIMWDILELPIHEKTKFVSNPKNGSIHNYGAAVDLTIVDLNGIPLDMGAGYDDIRKIAYPRYEKAYLDSGLLNTEQIENRELLRTVMHAGGFWGIETEWWHFNRYNRDKAKELFEIIE